MRNAIAFAVTVFLFPPLFGQFSERIDVRVHELEVVVETRDGKPVTDLQKDDFIVLQEGVPQTITNFFAVNETSATASAPDAARRETAEAAPPIRKPRKFIFFIDEFGMLDATRADLLRRCNDLVGAMHDGDEAMVITPASPQRIALFFTPDKELLVKTLERVTAEMMRKGDVLELGAPGVFAGRGPIEEGVLRRGDCGQSPQKCAEERLRTLISVLGALGELPGRKIMVLMTKTMSSVPGLKISDPQDAPGGDPRLRSGIVSDFRDVRRLSNEVARVAAAGNILIYGLETYEPGEQALPGVTIDHPTGSNESLTRSSKRGTEGTQDLLLSLADATGAKAFSGTRESDEMFEQISRDLSTYYSIGYRDADTKTKEHRVEVRVRNHPEYVVRARRTVRTITAEDEARGKAMAAVLSSNNTNPLQIRLTASPLVRKGRTVDIPVHVHVPLSRLTFLQRDDEFRAQFHVLVAAVGEHADFGNSNMEHAQDVIVPRSRWESAQAQEFLYDTTVRVSPGKYRIAVGVTDANSGESGFQTFTVEAR
jgi:VWFA-related protein